jgi:cytidylate kinase
MAVITISRQVGSGAHEISLLVCKQLGYQLLDRELMARVGAEAGITSGEVVDLTAEEHHVPGRLERFFSMPFQDVPAIGSYEASGAAAEDRSSMLVHKIILAAYEQGNLVIPGRGGQLVLRDKPGVLHVRVVAPLDQRIEYLMKRDGISADAARAKIKQADTAADDYIRRYYQAELADPLLYHFIINTGMVTQAIAAEMIIKGLDCLPTKGS